MTALKLKKAMGRLFEHQNKLPKLPVPTLDETVTRYLRTVRAVLEARKFAFPQTDMKVYERTEQAAKDFLDPNGMGRILQQRLLKQAKSTSTSWLHQWWMDLAYLTYREPVTFNVNYFFHFVDQIIPSATNAPQQISRAAHIILSASKFRDSIINESLEPEMAKTVPLCSQQYLCMFNSCRIPQKDKDFNDFYENTNVAVVCNGNFYTFDIKNLNQGDIENCLLRIKTDSKNKKSSLIGILTTQQRDVWAKIRNSMSQYQDTLRKLESSMFLVCLDDETPKTLEECARLFWHGNGTNRYFDKSLQFIVCENGKAGFNGEHSLMDATVTGRLCEWILKQKPNAQNKKTEAKIEHLEFKVEDSNILDAKKSFEKMRIAHDVKVFCYKKYGKNKIKTFQVSPDAYVQLGLQLAYYKTWKELVPVYESAQTRKYAYGRTEVGRSLTSESSRFIKAFVNKDVNAVSLFREAAKAHGEYMKLASDGYGVDRHLLGLQLLIRKNEAVPLLFADPMYSASKNWRMSTSQLTSELFDGYGWGQVVPDGYGLAYMIKNDSIHVNIASLHLKNDVMHSKLTEAFDELDNLLSIKSKL